MKKYFLLSLFIGFFSTDLFAQNFTISGYIKDTANGETFISAVVRVAEMPNIGAYTNNYGFYSVTLPKGNYSLLYSYLGYQTIERKIELNQNLSINVDLKKNSVMSKTIVITDKRKDESVKNTQMGQIELSTEQIKSIPALFGEVDVMKALQLLPGVQSVGEGQSGFYVRGGGPDQNLVLLDDATVYNTGHLFGFFSVFNADAIKNTTLIKGGMPANYCGRLSSVVDVTMKEGNNKELHGSGGIGWVASRFTLEGPIRKNKGSFIVSARRTYFYDLLKLIAPNQLKGTNYYFYDLNLKANYILGKKDRVYLSGYFGRDVFAFKNSSGTLGITMPWGNNTGTLRWNHEFNDKLFCNTSIIYNAYQISIGLNQNNFNLGLLSSIKDWNAKSDFDYFLNNKHQLKFGYNYIYHIFDPNAVTIQTTGVDIQPSEENKRHAQEGALYLLDDWTISSKLKANVGLRYSAYQQIGPYDYVKTDSNFHPTDTVHYNKGKIVKTYAGLGGFEPRITLRYELNDVSSIKAAYSHNNQYVHLVSSNGTTLPTDIWVPSTVSVKPQISDQYALGYFRNFKHNMFETSVEFYYKAMQNQIEYHEFYVPSGESNVEKDFIFGKGESHGAEIFINKKEGKLTGWIGYTLAFTNRKFAQLNNDNWYPAKYDRRHDVSFVASYEFNQRWKFSAVWVYASGNPITVPDALYQISGTLYEHFTTVNGYRLPAYHRGDISATYTPKKKDKQRFETSWTFAIYNVYSRFNPYFVYLDTNGSVTNGTASVAAKEMSIFPFPLPSVTWNFKF